MCLICENVDEGKEPRLTRHSGNQSFSCFIPFILFTVNIERTFLFDYVFEENKDKTYTTFILPLKISSRLLVQHEMISKLLIHIFLSEII